MSARPIKTTGAAAALAWSLAALALALVVIDLAITIPGYVAGRGQDYLSPSFGSSLYSAVAPITYALIGALIAARHPRNPIGWLFCAEGILFGLTLVSGDYAGAGQPAEATGTAFIVAQWLILWIWIPTTLLPLTFLLLLFPDGRLPSPRWRPVAWSAGLATAWYIVSTALDPAPSADPHPRPNPFGLQGISDLLNRLWIVLVLLLLVGTLGALAALIVRFRRAGGIEREQLKWLAYGGGLAMLAITVLGAWSGLHPDDLVAGDLAVGAVWFGLTVIAITAGVAILRHRLYDIDVIINRTLVYGALSGVVVGLYVLLVGSLGVLFQANGNLLIALLATGLAALAFQPLRARLQRGVNRLMYGQRDDPYAVLSQLSRQLKTTLAPTAVLPNITETVARTLKLPYVALVLAQESRLEIAASHGRPAANAVQLPLVYQAETVGHLVVAPRGPGEAFTPAERRLLEEIAVHAGGAVHAVRLTADLQRSHERLIMAREEERRRLRRDLHDGLGPQLASLTLTVAAARELLRSDTAAVDQLLGELAAHTQAAVADVRRVVYDLRPPALDDLGLILALREQAARYGQAGLQITVDAPERLPPLPAAVEVAAYRIVQEALTNVVRHAGARSCQVRLTLADTLGIEIGDDGVGLPASVRPGVGLHSMRERAAELGGACRVESWPGGGTCLRAWLPLEQEGVCSPSAS